MIGIIRNELEHVKQLSPRRLPRGDGGAVIPGFSTIFSASGTGASSSEKDSNSNADLADDAGSAILFGLPGNPVAVMVTFLAFVRPALLQMMGVTAAPPPLLKALCDEPMRKKPGRTEYQRGWVSTAVDGTLHVKTTGSQGSGVLRSMAEANGLIVLHHAQGNVAVGDPVDVMMFDGVI